MGCLQRLYLSKNSRESPPATIPAPWSCNRGVAFRSNIVVSWPKVFSAMPAASPPSDPPICYSRQHAFSDHSSHFISAYYDKAQFLRQLPFTPFLGGCHFSCVNEQLYPKDSEAGSRGGAQCVHVSTPLIGSYRAAACSFFVSGHPMM